MLSEVPLFLSHIYECFCFLQAFLLGYKYSENLPSRRLVSLCFGAEVLVDLFNGDRILFLHAENINFMASHEVTPKIQG